MYLKILKYAISPPNVVFPFPIIPILIGSFTGKVTEIWKPILLTLLFYPAINLWNHINDAQDDFKAGKDTPFIFDSVKNTTLWVISFLYLLSSIFIYFVGRVYGLLFFFLLFISTFLYSDNTILKIRLKKHYFGELLVYLVSIPSGVFMLYSTIKPPDFEAIKLALMITPFMLSTVFVKDLKDISADKKAGLKTLGVAFPSEFLLKISIIMMILYFLEGIYIFRNKIIFLVSFIPLIIFPYCIAKFYKLRWEISERTIVFYYIMIFSSLTSLVILTILTLIFALFSIF